MFSTGQASPRLTNLKVMVKFNSQLQQSLHSFQGCLLAPFPSIYRQNSVTSFKSSRVHVRQAHYLVKPHGKWDLVDNSQVLQRIFMFRNFATAWDFLTAISIQSKIHKHHPEMCNIYKHVLLRWTTHSIPDSGGASGLTALDMRMAKISDELASKFDEVVGLPEKEISIQKQMARFAAQVGTTIADSNDKTATGRQGDSMLPGPAVTKRERRRQRTYMWHGEGEWLDDELDGVSLNLRPDLENPPSHPWHTTKVTSSDPSVTREQIASNKRQQVLTLAKPQEGGSAPEPPIANISSSEVTGVQSAQPEPSAMSVEAFTPGSPAELSDSKKIHTPHQTKDPNSKI